MKDLSKAVLNSKKSSIRKLFELVLSAKNAISFGIGQPDFSAPEHVDEAFIKAIKQGKSQYAPTLGLPRLRELIAEKYRKENNIDWVNKENVMVSNGGSHALQLSYACLTNPGDEILVSSPNFLSYFYLSEFYGLKCVEIPRKSDLSPDFEKIQDGITQKTKFIIINSPNNPTGYVYTKEEMESLRDIVIDNDLYLISDEVYENFIYEGRTHISPACYDGMENRTITLNAMSKTFGTPGYRVGYIAAPSNVLSLMEKYAQYTAAGVSHPTQYAAISALENGNPNMDSIIFRYNENRKYCIERLKNMEFDVVEPRGAFYIMPSIEKFSDSSDQFAEELMKKQEVAVVPGSGFGSFSENLIRISYATTKDNLEEGFNRIEQFLQGKGYI